jgi:hypothetical protein
MQWQMLEASPLLSCLRLEDTASQMTRLLLLLLVVLLLMVVMMLELLLVTRAWGRLGSLCQAAAGLALLICRTRPLPCYHVPSLVGRLQTCCYHECRWTLREAQPPCCAARSCPSSAGVPGMELANQCPAAACLSEPRCCKL